MKHAPEMQRRHFEFIASMIRELKLEPKDRTHVAFRFAGRLAETNAAFDRERFMAACLIQQGGYDI